MEYIDIFEEGASYMQSEYDNNPEYYIPMECAECGEEFLGADWQESMQANGRAVFCYPCWKEQN